MLSNITEYLIPVLLALLIVGILYTTMQLLYFSIELDKDSLDREHDYD